MLCQFSLGYSSMFEPGPIHDPRSENAFGSQCQFQLFSEEELIQFDGKRWCPFHLPLKSADGEESVKKKWDFSRQAALSGRLAAYIEERRKSDRPIDLTGVVHWDRLTLSMTYSPDLMSGASWQGINYPGISIEGASFPRGVDFSHSVFSKGFHARNVEFGNQADFCGCTFRGDTFFSGARFQSDALFHQCKFESIADFSGSSFHGALNFFEANFQGAASFALYPDFSFIATPDAAREFRRAVFTKSLFSYCVTFNDRTFLWGPDFSFAKFGIAPEFHNCQIHQSANFDDATFSDIKSPGADRAYRTLKLAMEKLGSRDEQAMFFALEQKARAKKESTPGSIRVISELYELVSDFGQSFMRPIVALTALTFFFTFLYDHILPFATVNSPYSGVQLITFSLEQMIRPFSIWSSSYRPALTDSKAALLLRVLSSLHALGALGLVAICLFSLRRRFKIE